MTANCPSCANRRKIDGWDHNGGDFWVCTAKPLLPEFTLHADNSSRAVCAVNLAMFRENHPCFENVSARSCPLHSPIEDIDKEEALIDRAAPRPPAVETVDTGNEQ